MWHPPLFKTCKIALSSAKVATERTVLSNLLGMCLTKVLKEVEKPVVDTLVTCVKDLKFAESALKNLNATVKVTQEQGLKSKNEIAVNIRLGMSKDEMKLVDGCCNGESSFVPGQTYDNAAKMAQTIGMKKSILKANAPPAVLAKWEKVFQAVALLNENRQAYQQHVGWIKEVFGKYSLN